MTGERRERTAAHDSTHGPTTPTTPGGSLTRSCGHGGRPRGRRLRLCRPLRRSASQSRRRPGPPGHPPRLGCCAPSTHPMPPDQGRPPAGPVAVDPPAAGPAGMPGPTGPAVVSHTARSARPVGPATRPAPPQWDLTPPAGLPPPAVPPGWTEPPFGAALANRQRRRHRFSWLLGSRAAADTELSAQIERVRAPLRVPHVIAVVGIKGGAGKTVAALLGRVFAHYRGDRIIAADVAPAGTLGERLLGGQARRSIRDMIREMTRGVGPDLHVGRFVDLAGRLEVLPAEIVPTKAAPLDLRTAMTLADTLRRSLRDHHPGLWHRTHPSRGARRCNRGRYRRHCQHQRGRWASAADDDSGLVDCRPPRCRRSAIYRGGH